MTGRLLGLLLAAMLWSMPVHSHHNPAAGFLVDEVIVLEGVVTRLRLINPHARIYFTVTTKTGEVESWLAVGHAPGVLRRAGWTKNTLKKGDIIKITGNPGRNNRKTLNWTSIVMADGTELGGGLPDENDLKKQLEDLDKKRRRR